MIEITVMKLVPHQAFSLRSRAL